MRARLAAVALALLGCDDAAPTLGDARPAPAIDAAIPAPDAGAPQSRLIHVAVDGDAGANGSRDRPFATTAAAYTVARAGDVVLLGPGDHGPIEGPPAGVDLRGSGIARTRVGGQLSLSHGQSLGALTLVGSAVLAGRAELVDVEIRDALAPAVLVAGAATLNDVVVHGTQAPAEVDADAGPAAAVVVRAEGHLSWRGGAVREAAVSAIRVDGGQIEAAHLDLSQNQGFGVFQDGGVARLTDLRVFAPRAAGLRFVEAEIALDTVRVFDPQFDDTQNTGTGLGLVGSTGTARSVYVRGGDRAFRVSRGSQVVFTELFADRPTVDGLGVGGEAHVEVHGLEVVGPRNAGFVITGATLDARDVVVRDAGRLGGLVADGGHLTLDGLAVRGETVRGLAVLNASGTLRGLTLEDASDGCLQLTDPSGPIVIEGGQLRRCGAAAVGVFGDTAPITLRDLTVEGTYAAGTDLGLGVSIYRGAATLERVISRHNEGAGIQIDGGTAVLTDCEVSDNAAPGVAVLEASAPVQLTRLTAERNRGAGVLVAQSAARLVEPRVAENVADPAIGTGDGIAGFLQAELNVEGGFALDNAGSGVSLTQFSRGTVTGGVRLEGNQAWGLNVACDGSALDAAVDAQFAGNRRGAQNACR